MTPELQAAFEAVLSEDFELRFVGEFVPGYAKPIVLDKSSVPGALKNLQASFPWPHVRAHQIGDAEGQRLVGRSRS